MCQRGVGVGSGVSYGPFTYSSPELQVDWSKLGSRREIPTTLPFSTAKNDKWIFVYSLRLDPSLVLDVNHSGGSLSLRVILSSL